jgi:L-aminopeptidase/D-esterase-like protein
VQNGKFYSQNERLSNFTNDRLLLRNTNTTLAVAASNARLSKVDTFRVSQRMHDGMSRAIHPCHTTFDGDVSFALSTGEVTAPIDLVAELAAEATSQAIRNAVRAARGRGGVKGLLD